MNNNSFKVLDDLGVINAFLSKPVDYSIANANRLIEASKKLNVNSKKIYKARQTHSDNVIKVLDNDKLDDPKFDNADGLITNVKGNTLFIAVADCQGIFLYDKVNNVIGNIHSGWKGTLNKIVIKGIDIMVNDYNSNKDDIIVCFNPSICQKHFEVEDDVYSQFKSVFNSLLDKHVKIGDIINDKQKYYIDTVLLNKELLINYGINENNIYLSNECTYCNHDIYHSYRYDKTPLRNGCFISIK